MEITEVRIKLNDRKGEKLKAFCSVTLDHSFVIRDLKIIEGGQGLFVAMPSRKLMERCTSCESKNHLRARYCNDCGHEISADRGNQSGDERRRLHVDIAHPINAKSREFFQSKVLYAYEAERIRSREPGYKPVGLGVEDFD